MSERPKRVAALRYVEGTEAPEVVAAGAGEAARAILAAAHEAGVPVREDAALAEALSRLDVGRVVPPELYVAVAEALVWAYRLDARAAGGGARPPRGTAPRPR
jgi:flagellar biosynthesis protein